MTTVRLDIAYDGTGFRGWARQPRVRTVQGTIEASIERALGTPVRLSVAGRTDAGVHASGQVASFVAPEAVDLERLRRAINGMLGPEVVVRAVRRAPQGFDARRSAIEREYVYRVDLAGTPSPFTARFVWHRPGSPSLPAMREAAALLVGPHDFASFCRAPQPEGAPTARTLRVLAVTRTGSEIRVRAAADSFLHQMVRSLVGTLLAVGDGRMPAASMGAVLAARRRSAAGPVAPPRGLTLVRVRYARVV